MATPDGAMITAGQLRAARAVLGWTREDLAAKAGVSASTIKNYEAGRATITAVSTALERTLVEQGFEFDQSRGMAGIRWREPG